jgi:UDP-N-acetylglucosamine--N-acetylmuramyl-(pentapeptide) pyrophosphoryl-undecaprenol N-acetylglucosamine transferase
MEERIVVARGLQFKGIKAGKFRRNHFAGRFGKIFNLSTLGPNARDALRTVGGVSDALRILHKYKPDVVFLKGGFVCVPVGIAAKLLKIPFVTHESDITPGLANRMLGKWAVKIAVGFPVNNYHGFGGKRLVFTGSPVRKEILGAHRLEGLAKFHLSEKLPVVFVTGGSGGARQVNDSVLAALPQLLEFCQVIHLTGEGEFERVQFALKRLGQIDHIERYQAFGFLTNDMGMAMAAADLVISRAGANTVAELAALGKPTVLIPNYEMAGHQVENAKVLSRAGAARVLDGEKLTGDRLVGEVKRLLGDPEEMERLAKGIARYAKPDAASELAQLIMEVGAGQRPASRGEGAPE